MPIFPNLNRNVYQQPPKVNVTMSAYSDEEDEIDLFGQDVMYRLMGVRNINAVGQAFQVENKVFFFTTDNERAASRVFGQWMYDAGMSVLCYRKDGDRDWELFHKFSHYDKAVRFAMEKNPAIIEVDIHEALALEEAQ